MKGFGRGKKKEAASQKVQMPTTSDVSRGKRSLLIVLMIAIIGCCFGVCYFLINIQQEEINVIRLKNTKVAGDLLQENDIEKLSMPRSFYEEYGVQTYEENGKKVTRQAIVKWSDREKLVGKYMVNYTQSGTFMTDRHVTADTVLKNPWTSKIPEGYEVYTLPFSAKDIDTNMLTIGTTLRVRSVAQVEAMQARELKKKIADNDKKLANGNYISTGESLIVDAIQSQGGGLGAQWGETSSGNTVPVAEVIFDKITIVDMLNSAGESIFELYLDLLKKPVDERIPYLETTLEGSDTSFRSKVSPVSLILIVSRDEASRLAEFENLGANLKYTILPNEDSDFNLMDQFVEISSQINSFIQSAPGTSLN